MRHNWIFHYIRMICTNEIRVTRIFTFESSLCLGAFGLFSEGLLSTNAWPLILLLPPYPAAPKGLSMVRERGGAMMSRHVSGLSTRMLHLGPDLG